MTLRIHSIFYSPTNHFLQFIFYLVTMKISFRRIVIFGACRTLTSTLQITRLQRSRTLEMNSGWRVAESDWIWVVDAGGKVVKILKIRRIFKLAGKCVGFEIVFCKNRRLKDGWQSAFFAKSNPLENRIRKSFFLIFYVY